MSAPVAAAPRTAPVRGGGGGFGSVLRAEFTKFRTVRGWVIGSVLAGVLTVIMGVLGAGHASIECRLSGGVTKSGAACVPPVPHGPGGILVNDSYYLVGQPLVGSGTLTVRVTSLTGRYDRGNQGAAGANPLAGLASGVQPWSKAGIIITASTKQGAAYAAIMATGAHGVAMQYDYTHDVTGLAGRAKAAAPRWLRLIRSGATVTGYDSADGVHWLKVGVAHLPGMTSTVQAGMFATSPLYEQLNASSLGGGESGQISSSIATGVFDHVRLAGGPAGGQWSGDNVGGQQPFGPNGQVIGYHAAAGRYTVTGSGDIAPLVNGPTAPGPVSTIEQHLVGTFAGLIAVVVVAAMFVTAEYRRGLIRTTLAASPRRGQVLAAKAVVVAAVSFVVALAAALVSLAIGIPMDRGQGMLIIPVSTLTEVRVVAGTAALVAVAAVLALGIGVLLRRSAAAVTASIVAVVFTYILGVAHLLPGGASTWVLRVTPAAAFAIQQSLPHYAQVSNDYSVSNGYFPLAWWAGFGVLCLYAAAALAGAFFVLKRRDA